MSVFFITFFSIYGGAHVYAFLKARAGLGFGLRAGLPLALFMAVMVFAPIAVRMFETRGLHGLARGWAFVGYTWLGLLFFFFSVSITLDLYRLAVQTIGFVAKTDVSAAVPSAKFSFYLALFLAVAIGTYGYFEALDFRIETLTIKTPKVPVDVGRLRIVQVSDIHLGLLVRQKRLRTILEIVENAKPDVLVSTGDLVDGLSVSFNGYADILKDFNPKYGKFSITGNHEYYVGIKQSVRFMQEAGFKVLRGESVRVAGFLNLAGVDDATGRRMGEFKGQEEAGLLGPLSRKDFTVLLKHRPRVVKGSIGLFDLQLSGHTHKGQIFPFTIATALYFPVPWGTARLGQGSMLHVSRGTGTWGPLMRFLAPPEITIIDLVHESGG